MKWKQPPVIKIYEALGAVADERIEISGNTGKVYSSSGNKFYEVSYDKEADAIMANDNGSYWQGYLGYPSIAFLFKIGVLEYRKEFGELLKGIAWKDINQKFKNNFDKTLEFILSTIPEDKKVALNKYIEGISEKIENLDLNLLGKKRLPPAGY